MLETTVAQFRKQARHYLDMVEQGDVVRIIRKGKPVADLVPVAGVTPAWKNDIQRITLPGFYLSREILKDRADSEA
jgi:prevent-host-death family protein